MKNTLIFILITLSCNAQKIAFKSFSDSTGNYLIEYKYYSDFALVPSVVGAKPHYNADIKVSKLYFKSDTIQIFLTKGVFVEGGCFEDIPANHVSDAKKHIADNHKILIRIEDDFLRKVGIGCCGISPSNKFDIGGQTKKNKQD